jgi:hypothetical protein
MGRAGIEQILFFMDEAFEGDREHAFLRNLRSVRDEDWLWLPPGGARSPFDIVRHVGECKYVYENHAFGDASMRWDRPGSVPTIEPSTPRDEVIAWLREGQRLLRSAFAALDDSELTALRNVNWGERYETRRIMSIMIEHDLYHGGEINHLRALRHGNDRWAWEQG